MQKQFYLFRLLSILMHTFGAPEMINRHGERRRGRFTLRFFSLFALILTNASAHKMLYFAENCQLVLLLLL